MDAAVLSAVRVTGTVEQPGRTAELIVACDALLGLIPSPQEIEHAVQLLTGAQLMAAGDDAFGITPAGRQIVAGARGGVDARIRTILDTVVRLPVTPRVWKLDKRLYDQAVLDHQHRMWSDYRKERKRYRL